MKKIEEIAMEYALPQRKYKLAKECYESLAELLTGNNIQCRIYPQGSFSYGAITKPYKDGKDSTFDLDVIIEFPDTDDTYAKEMMQKIEKIIKNSSFSKYQVKIHENGFTIYFENDLSMDIIPAKSENLETKIDIFNNSKEPVFTHDSIKIPKFNEQRYSFIKNNPKGYKKWFDNINRNSITADYVRNFKVSLLSETHNLFFSNIDEIPDDYVVTPLQKVIILLKRLRDVYYSRIKRKNKPLSGMLCLLACEAVKDKPYLSFNDTLTAVIDYMLSLKKGDNLNSLHLDDGKWKLINPTNCYDDLADNWQNSIIDGQVFFDFISKINLTFCIGIKNNIAINESVISSMFGRPLEDYTDVKNTGKSWKA